MAFKKPGEEKELPAKHSQTFTSTFNTDGPLYTYAARPGYSERIGATLPTGTYKGSDPTTALAVESGFRVAGVARVNFVPVFGVSADRQSYLNKASDRIYRAIQDFLRQRNLQYQASDVTIVLMCLDSIISAYMYGHRAYRFLNMANPFNNYYNEALCAAAGINYDDWENNRPKIVEKLLEWRTDMSQIGLPRVVKAFDTHYEMLTRIYADAASNKAQIYVCTPAALWSYERVDEGKGLKAVDFGGNLTWQMYCDKMDAMIDAVKNSTDFDIISAAIRSTFADRGFFEMPEPTREPMAVYRDAYFLTTLTNATPWAPKIATFAVRDSRQNYLTCDPIVYGPIQNSSDAYVPAHVFNTIEDDPTSNDMVNYCRWHLDVDPTYDDVAGGLHVKSMGTELITSVQIVPINNNSIFYKSAVNGASGYVANIDYSTNGWDGFGSNAVTAAANIAARMTFKWYPIQWIRFIHGAGANAQEAYIPIAQWNFCFTYGTGDVVSAHNAWLDACFMDAAPFTPKTEE